jgi:hypothetical protein
VRTPETEMNRANPAIILATAEHEPLLCSSNRVAVGPEAARQVDTEGLSPVGDRPFLLRFLEPIKAGKHDKTGATPPETTNPDSEEDGKEDQGLPDYEP